MIGLRPHLAILFLLFTASCALPSQERRVEIPPKMPPPSNAQGSAAHPPPPPRLPPSGHGDGHPWTLQEVLDRIRQANPDLAAARAAVEEAKWGLQAARSAYLPTLTFSEGYLSTDNPGQAFGLLLNQERLSLGPGFDPTPGPTDNWHSEVRVDWSLWEPGRRDQLLAAGAGREMAESLRKAQQIRLLNAGLQAWIELRAARALEEVAHRSVGVVSDRLAKTRVRQGDGAALPVDVLRLEVRLAAARQAESHAHLRVQRAAISMGRLLALPAGEGIATAGEAPEVELSATGVEQLIARAREGREDLRAARKRLRMAELDVASVSARWQPTLAAFASYAIDGRNLELETELGSYIAGIELRWPLSARTRDETQAARARVLRTRHEITSLVLRIESEVRAAAAEVAAAREILRVAETAVTAAEEAYRVVAAAQDQGAATVTDVLEAENALQKARVQRVAARAGLASSQAMLALAVGEVR